MTELKPELKAQIEKEAEEYGDKTGFDTTGYYSTHQDRENSYLAGAEKYALKLQQAEERLDQMAKALEWIKIYPTTDDVIKLYIEQHLTEYNNYKQTKDGKVNG